MLTISQATRMVSKNVDNLTDMTALLHKTEVDLREARKNKKSGRHRNVCLMYIQLSYQHCVIQVPRKLSPMEDDDIQEAANAFEAKEDRRKARKNRKGGHQDKVCLSYINYLHFLNLILDQDTLSSTTSVKQMRNVCHILYTSVTY